MNTAIPLRLITAIVDKNISSLVKLADMALHYGLNSMNIITGRVGMLQQRKGLLGFFAPGASLINESADIFMFLVAAGAEEACLGMLTDVCRLKRGGRATVFSEEVEQVRACEACGQVDGACSFSGEKAKTDAELMGICCIVQRGRGDDIARVTLETGTCVPSTFFGIGTGVRDKLGLLRVAISAEKEVIQAIASTYDAEMIMDMMIDAGKLDQPGNGFIYIHPLSRGIVNARVSTEAPRHAASMEQIISAIDELKSGFSWRSRGVAEKGAVGSRPYLSSLVGFMLFCDDGTSNDLVSAAMAAGAAGATINKMKLVHSGGADYRTLSPARELCSMIVGEKQVPVIVEALEKAGAFGDNGHAKILLRKVPKAC